MEKKFPGSKFAAPKLYYVSSDGTLYLSDDDDFDDEIKVN